MMLSGYLMDGGVGVFLGAESCEGLCKLYTYGIERTSYAGLRLSSVLVYVNLDVRRPRHH